MKRVLIILIIALLSGCSTSKKIQRSIDSEIVTHIENTTTEQSHSDKTHSESAKFTTNEQVNEEVVISAIEYDTDKPIDPTTGKRPIKKETTETRMRVVLKVNEATSEVSEVTSENSKIEGHTTIDVEERIIESETTQIKKRWGGSIWITFSIVGVFVAIWLFRKLKNKI